jgi:hypothetical protein
MLTDSQEESSLEEDRYVDGHALLGRQNENAGSFWLALAVQETRL